jgi:DNA segregation ATPase FtsK/SpoIIIE-like protein
MTVLADIPAQTTSRDFHLSEHLSDAARIHHERAHFDPALYDRAVEEVRRLRVASIYFLRRHLRIEYTQAAYFIICMETDGIIRRADYRSRDARRGWRYEVVAPQEKINTSGLPSG